MATIKRQPFQTVKVDMEEMERKIREHRLKIVKTAGIVVGAIVFIWLLFYIISQVRTYDSHQVKSSYERQDALATTFLSFQDNILKYSNDGVFYTDESNNLIWNQTYEMTEPIVAVKEKYAAIGDKKGNLIYIFDKEGVCGKLETTKPILRIKIANQGAIAVLMEENGISYLEICDRTGKLLAEGELHAENSGYPLDIALSDDGESLAVAMLDVTEGISKTKLSFYNFGSAGKKKIDNVVGSCTYSDLIIPQIEYIGNNKLLAVGDKKMLFIEGTQNPKEKKAITFDGRLRTFFYDEKYIGMIFDNNSSAEKEKKDVYCMKIYDERGTVIRQKTFTRTYRKAEFLDNHEICLLNDNECSVFSLRGVEKYHEALDKNIYKILPGSSASKYTFILEGETAEVKLK